jgi:hypothetical protein
MAWPKQVCFLFLVLSVCSGSALGDTSCEKEIRPIVKELNVKIRSLEKSEPKIGTGRQVNVGSCASRLRKLAGNFLCCKTFANTAPVWEEISCLQLKKHYLEKSCECAGQNGGYSLDETLQDSVYEQYQAFKTARKEAMKRGIPNKLIRSYVSEVTKRIDCINSQTLQIVTESTRQLETLLPEQR